MSECTTVMSDNVLSDLQFPFGAWHQYQVNDRPFHVCSNKGQAYGSGT